MPDWLASLVVVVAAVAVAAIVHFALFAALTRMSDSQPYLKVIERRVRGPALLALMLIAVQIALEVVPWDNAATIVSDVLLVGLIVLIGWIVLRSLQIASDLYLRRFSIDVEDNLLARKHHTQVRILRRATATIVIIVTVAAVLMTFEGVRQYGVSLLASAGAAGIILGLALQPLLKNLIAGIQIAISQPIRIEDAVIVEGEWGWIEEITSTYVVVRIWDWRRLVLPLSYFIEHPFQNWTKQDASLIGSVFLYADYTVPVDRVRAKLQEVVEASPLWDKKVVNTQVSDSKEETLEIRLLVSAKNAPTAWDLRCEVREKMIAFLRDELPECLPKRRLDAPVTLAREPQPVS